MLLRVLVKMAFTRGGPLRLLAMSRCDWFVPGTGRSGGQVAGGTGSSSQDPAFHRALPSPSHRQIAGLHVTGQRRTGTDVDAVPDGDRRYQGGIGADEGV